MPTTARSPSAGFEPELPSLIRGNEELQVLLFNLPQKEAHDARRSLVPSRYTSLGRAELQDELFATLGEGKAVTPDGLKRLQELVGARYAAWDRKGGLTKKQFVDLLGDETQTSTDALRHALLTLRGDNLSGKPWSRRSVVQRLRASDAANMDRRSMIQAIFTTLDNAKSGLLSAEDVRAYAEQTGFEGSDADWAEQYEAMCQHFGWTKDGGITRDQFSELIEDDDETDDDELRQAMLNLQMQAGKSGRASVVGSSWQRKSLLHLPNVDIAKNMSRSDITAKVFSLLDVSGRSRLSSGQIKKFADLSGFEGDAEEWTSQFSAMCEHFGWTASEGVSQSQFVDFIGDEVEHSDDELRRVLVSLQAQRQLSSRYSISSQSWSRRSFVLSLRGSDAANMDRRSMIQAIFTTLDNAKSGLLSAEDVRAYAEQTGFEGSDADWAEQYEAMCQHFGWTKDGGITRDQFSELIEDDDETDDDELRQAMLNLQMQAGKSGRASVVGSSWQRKRSLIHTPSKPDFAEMDRRSMIQAIFTTLDNAKSGLLSAEDVRAYAEQTGFEGSDADWAEQYEAMCQHFGWTKDGGITRDQFSELIEDDDETDDDELRQAMLNLQMQAGKIGRASVVGSSWQRKSLLHLPNVDIAKNMSRSDITAKVFSLLDVSGRSRLSSGQIKKFADLSGFEGDAEEWTSQFSAMCEHFGWTASEGVSQSQFVDFIGDEVEHSDDELRRVLVSLQTQR